MIGLDKQIHTFFSHKDSYNKLSLTRDKLKRFLLQNHILKVISSNK